MRRRVSLNAVRAFEAAARYQSLTRAANELCVTPTALSHHVRWLEDFLQVQLFERKNGGLRLTPAAAACLPDLTEGLDRIDAALSALTARDKRSAVVVGASPSVTSLWLLPRLRRFVESKPEVDVVLRTLSGNATADTEIDVSICNWSPDGDQRIDHLMEDEIIPVCSPRLFDDGGASGEAALARLPLIHDDKRLTLANGAFPTWQRYFDAMGMARETEKGVRFNQSNLAVAAAIDGYGMMLGRSQLVSGALDDGRLVRVGCTAYPIRFEYVVASKWHTEDDALSQFRDWLIAEAKETRTAPALPH